MAEAQGADAEGQLWSEPQKRSEDEQEDGENGSNANNPKLDLGVQDNLTNFAFRTTF